MFKFGLSSREMDILSRTLAEVQELRLEITNLRQQLDRAGSAYAEVTIAEGEAGILPEEEVATTDVNLSNGDKTPEMNCEVPEEAPSDLLKENVPEGPVVLENQNPENAVMDGSKTQLSLDAGSNQAIAGEQDEKPGIMPVTGGIQKLPSGSPEEKESCSLSQEGAVQGVGEGPGNQPLGGEPQTVGGEEQTPAACEEPEINLPAAAGDWAVVKVPPRNNPWWRFWRKKMPFGKSV